MRPILSQIIKKVKILLPNSAGKMLYNMLPSAPFTFNHMPNFIKQCNDLAVNVNNYQFQDFYYSSHKLLYFKVLNIKTIQPQILCDF